MKLFRRLTEAEKRTARVLERARRKPRQLVSPPEPPRMEPDIFVTTEGWRRKEQSGWQLSSYPLVQGVANARQGETVRVAPGRYPHLIIGGSDSNDPYMTRRPIRGVTVESDPTRQRPEIGGVRFEEISGHRSLTWDELTFRHLDIWHEQDGLHSPFFVTDTNQRQGLIRLYDFSILDEGRGWEGYPAAFGIRFTGQAALDIRRGSVPQMQYHAIYCDNLGSSCFQDLSLVAGWRTSLQITNRTLRSQYGPLPIPGVGDILVHRVLGTGGQGTTGQGSAFTFKGQLGTVAVRDCEVMGGQGGALVVHTEYPQSNTPPNRPDVFTDDAGFSTSEFILDNFSAYMTYSDRKLIGVSGVGRTEFSGDLNVEWGFEPVVAFDDGGGDGWIENGVVYPSVPLQRLASAGFVTVKGKTVPRLPVPSV